MSDCVRYPAPGCIVEYMEGNAAQIALVTGRGGRPPAPAAAQPARDAAQRRAPPALARPVAPCRAEQGRSRARSGKPQEGP